MQKLCCVRTRQQFSASSDYCHQLTTISPSILNHFWWELYQEVRTDPFHPFSSEERNQQTSTMLRTFLVQNLPNPIGPESTTSGPISSSRPTVYSSAALELMSFKKGIKREITAYPSLKDERYFDGFKRSLFIVAKTHKCSDVLDPNYTPGSVPEAQELFKG